MIKTVSVQVPGLTPALTLKPNGTYTTNVSVSTPTVMELNLTTPNYTDTFYTLFVSVPPASGPRVKICSIQVAYEGVNVPCYNPQPPVYVSSDGSANYDSVIWKLGRILNTGQRAYNEDPQANVIKFLVIVQPLNTAVNLPGNTMIIKAAVDYGLSGLSKLINSPTLTVVTPSVGSMVTVSSTLFTTCYLVQLHGLISSRFTLD